MGRMRKRPGPKPSAEERERFPLMLEPSLRARLERLSKTLPGEPSVSALIREAIIRYLQRTEAVDDLAREIEDRFAAVKAELESHAAHAKRKGKVSA